jgi:hypothetical protein
MPVKETVFGAGAGDNANLSHLFFFFIVCLNFKTAKFSSIDVSVSVVWFGGHPMFPLSS